MPHGCELVAEERGEFVVGHARGARVLRYRLGQGGGKVPLGECGVVRERREEPGVGGVAGDLGDDLAHLAPRGHDARLVGAGIYTAWDGAQPVGDHRPDPRPCRSA